MPKMESSFLSILQCIFMLPASPQIFSIKDSLWITIYWNPFSLPCFHCFSICFSTTITIKVFLRKNIISHSLNKKINVGVYKSIYFECADWVNSQDPICSLKPHQLFFSSELEVNLDVDSPLSPKKSPTKLINTFI